MKLVEWVYRVLVSTGSAWVMWVMIILSILSVAIILERAWFFLSLRDDIGALVKDLTRSLDTSLEAAQKRMSASPSAEAAVVLAGLEMAHRGPEAAEEAMNGAAAIQRMKLEKRLAFLGTLGNNAPFIGLFGTVIGVMIAFGKLGAEQGSAQSAAQVASKDVMLGISEALVATAVGIFVAIPAVAANNTFQRLTKATLANTEALSRTLLAFLKSDPSFKLPVAREAARESAPEARNRRVDDKKAEGEKASAKTEKASSKKREAEESDEEES
jgi:biopolymer transport protein ExbB